MNEAADKLAAVRALVTASTQRLLGDTIGVDDDAWRSPSRLPRWSRGHVATHLARQADALGRLVDWARTGVRQEMYASPQVREDEIESGEAPESGPAAGGDVVPAARSALLWGALFAAASSNAPT